MERLVAFLEHAARAIDRIGLCILLYAAAIAELGEPRA